MPQNPPGWFLSPGKAAQGFPYKLAFPPAIALVPQVKNQLTSPSTLHPPGAVQNQTPVVVWSPGRRPGQQLTVAAPAGRHQEGHRGRAGKSAPPQPLWSPLEPHVCAASAARAWAWGVCLSKDLPRSDLRRLVLW